MFTAASFLAGLLFGVGLIVAGMANPEKVLGFLDLAGAWDPSLALVMAGAIAVGSGAYALMRQKTRTLLGAPVRLPMARGIDRRLVLGSLVFGVGWGLAGAGPRRLRRDEGTGVPGRDARRQRCVRTPYAKSPARRRK